jgi:hypothetical protein
MGAAIPAIRPADDHHAVLLVDLVLPFSMGKTLRWFRWREAPRSHHRQ